MKKVTLAIVLTVLSHVAFAEKTCQEIIDEFRTTWLARADKYERKANYHVGAFVVIFLIAAVNTAIKAKEKKAIILGLAVTLSTQVIWLFDIEPKRLQHVSQKIRLKIERFSDSIHGLELSGSADKRVTDRILKEKNNLLNELWLLVENAFDEEIKNPFSGQEASIKMMTSFISSRDSVGCLTTEFNLQEGKLRVNEFTLEISPTVLEDINNDHDGLYIIGSAIGKDIDESALNTDLCVVQSLNKMILTNGGNKSRMTTQNAATLSIGMDLTKSYWFKYIPLKQGFLSVKIVRVPKALVAAYYNSLNDLSDQNAEVINKDFTEKLMAIKIAKFQN